MADNFDELIRQMEADELADRAELGKMTPREYAQMKGMAPQLVYYYVRTRKLKLEACICGRRVIDVPTADAFFSEKAQKERAREGLGSTDSTG